MTPAPSAARPRPADPCVFVIFGAQGDLANRLLLPALYNLAAQQLLPPAFAIVGVARAEVALDAFCRDAREALQRAAGERFDATIADALIERMWYVHGEFADPATYARLRDALATAQAARSIPGNFLFYLAIPPTLFGEVVRQLGASGLTRERETGWRRVVIEKPFGTDLPSAQHLYRELRAVLEEHQIWPIDHYLGKETVQNIMVLRFANGLFEPIWNRAHVDHVQITVAESLTVEHRGKFYDATGALRDMVPNHLFQLLALTAMEPPTSFASDPVRNEKTKVLAAVRPFAREEALQSVVRARYEAGAIDGRAVPRYRDEPGVAPDSSTETYVALRLIVDNWRWAGVPFYLRTGKALAKRRTEIAIRFKQAPIAMLRDTKLASMAANYLVLRIQPDEGIALEFNAKTPGPRVQIQGVQMDMRYDEYFHVAPQTGYETLIYDCMIGEGTLFQRAENIEAAWAVVQPILDAWRDTPATVLPTYTAGSGGPLEADALLERDGAQWRRI
jgi:glucose-6-phosphate 1-dehydrogenase